MFLRFFGVIFSKKIGDFSDFFEGFRVATASCPADREEFLARTAPTACRAAKDCFLARQANKTPFGRASAA